MSTMIDIIFPMFFVILLLLLLGALGCSVWPPGRASQSGDRRASA